MSQVSGSVGVGEIKFPGGVFFCLVAAVFGLAVLWLAGPNTTAAAEEVLGVGALAFGLIAFFHHGRRRVTAPGVYCLCAGVFIGLSLIYFRRSALSPPLTANELLHAGDYAYLSTVVLYLWWQRTAGRGLRPVGALGAERGRFAVRWGAALLAVGLVGHFTHLASGGAGASIETGAAFDGAMLLAVGVIAGSRRLRGWRLMVACAALGLYVATQFDGFGRLVLVSLAFAILLAIQHYVTVRHLKVLVVAGGVLALIAFAYVGRTRNPADPSELQAGGLSSVITPLENFATETATHMGPDTHILIGDITYIVPRAIWHGKPLGFGQILASEISPDVFALNPTLSTAGLNQGGWYYIGGWIGLFGMIAFTGWLLSAVDSALRRRSPLVASNGQFLAFISLVLIAGAAPDLAWNGISTWWSRTLPRLIVIAAVALWTGFGSTRRRTNSNGPALAPRSRYPVRSGSRW